MSKKFSTLSALIFSLASCLSLNQNHVLESTIQKYEQQPSSIYWINKTKFPSHETTTLWLLESANNKKILYFIDVESDKKPEQINLYDFNPIKDPSKMSLSDVYRSIKFNKLLQNTQNLEAKYQQTILHSKNPKNNSITL